MAVLATFARICTQDLEATLASLAACGVGPERLRVGHAAGLRIVIVGAVVVLAGTDEQLAPFRATQLTVVVDDLDDAFETARVASAVVVRERAEQVTGRNVTVRFIDSTVIEFVQWNDETRHAVGV